MYKQRYKNLIYTFDSNWVVHNVETYKSINAAKKANRGNTRPNLRDMETRCV